MPIDVDLEPDELDVAEIEGESSVEGLELVGVETFGEVHRARNGSLIHCCSVCPYKTCYRSNLRRHARSHTGEKPYTCRYCGKQLKQHLRRHEVACAQTMAMVEQLEEERQEYMYA
ncbi:transcriptional repressor CTCF-like [Tropilaelaps mercedesae]|uniref:Transcriptional repressor CTCF-like n=1 Tax=Tropilaelaps mercedesae TaxID=418985 RepID=A0A1V9Y0S2_9ACAR|nr:transcriptional repressor CTCF-like [Tropilaelaps mercedesae]